MQQILVAAGAVAVLGAAIAVLVRIALWVNKLAVRTKDFLDDWFGERDRPGVPRRAGVVERLSAIESRLFRVERELRPDGGETLRDAVDRVEHVVSPDSA